MAKPVDIKSLKMAIVDIDAMAQTELTEIVAIVQLALIALENPRAHERPELIANALGAIWRKAEQLENSINSEAEEVDSAYTDESICRRYAARSAAQEGTSHA